MSERSPTTFLRDGSSSIVVDEGHWPVVIATWFGEPTEALVEKYFAHTVLQYKRAREGRERFVLITDTYATDRPSPKARKRIADLAAKYRPESKECTLHAITIIESALIRGVVTALSWVQPELAETENVGSFDVAIQRALAALRAAGVAPPAVLPKRQERPAA